MKVKEQSDGHLTVTVNMQRNGSFPHFWFDSKIVYFYKSYFPLYRLNWLLVNAFNSHIILSYSVNHLYFKRIGDNFTEKRLLVNYMQIECFGYYSCIDQEPVAHIL